jgi:hypothetical protein
MDPGALQSYVRFMRERLFDHIDVPPGAWRVPDGTLPQAVRGRAPGAAVAGGGRGRRRASGGRPWPVRARPASPPAHLLPHLTRATHPKYPFPPPTPQKDVAAYCRDYEAAIEAAGGLDVQARNGGGLGVAGLGSGVVGGARNAADAPQSRHAPLLLTLGGPLLPLTPPPHPQPPRSWASGAQGTSASTSRAPPSPAARAYSC